MLQAVNKWLGQKICANKMDAAKFWLEKAETARKQGRLEQVERCIEMHEELMRQAAQAVRNPWIEVAWYCFGFSCAVALLCVAMPVPQ